MPLQMVNRGASALRRQLFATTVSALLLLALGTKTLSAEESGKDKITAGHLMFSNIAIYNYTEEMKAKGELPTDEGMQAAIIRYYNGLSEQMDTLSADSSVNVSVYADSRRGQFMVDVDFSLKRDAGTRVENLDLSSYSPLFNKGVLPRTLEVLFTGSHRIALAPILFGFEAPTKSSDEQFYRLDFLKVHARSRGHAAHKTDEADDPGYFLHFPEGYTQQHLVLSGLQFDADIDRTYYDFVERWTIEGASGYQPRWPRAGSSYMTFKESSNGEYQVHQDQEITFQAELTVHHQNATGSLHLAMKTHNPNDINATEMVMTGSVDFPRLELGDGLPLSSVTLTFDGDADLAEIQANVLRSPNTALNLPGMDITANKYPQFSRTFDLTGVYNFSTQFFDGMAADVPVRFYAPLGLSKAVIVSTNYAVCNDSDVGVRDAADIDAETLGHLQKDDRVEIRARSTDRIKIGEMNDYWYLVRRVSDNLIGWSYGYFLEFEE